MTKADIARAVYERHGGLSSREAARLVDLVFALVKDRLLSGEKVQITGFGTFLVKTRLARRGRNPKTGKIIPIRARRSVFFRSSPQVAPTSGGPRPSSTTPGTATPVENRRPASAGRPAA